MTEAAPQRNALLRNHGGGHAPVSYLELFFDLVYVFAITQVSHFLLYNLSWQGLIQGALVFAAIWWAWVYTTWAANWADPDRVPVRLVLIAAMFASLVMAVSVPKAFAGGGLAFALAYSGLQVGRTLFMVWAMRGTTNSRGMLRISVWFAVSAIGWIAGALTDSATDRMAWWTMALAIEYAGPACLFRVPGLGRSRLQDWDISGGHMAERCALFIIIALGEGIVVMGATFAKADPAIETALAFLIAFAGSVLMWWLYFDFGASRGAEHIKATDNPGLVARNAYTYLHILIVLGIVGQAVSYELLLAHPVDPASSALIAYAAGGTALYMIGIGFFKRRANTFNNFPFSHLTGLVLLLVLTGWSWATRPAALAVSGLLAVLLFVLAVWEWGSFHGGWKERYLRLRGR